MVFIIDGATDKGIAVEHLVREHGVDSAGGAVKADCLIFRVSSVNDGFVVAPDKIGCTDYRTNAFAQTAIHTGGVIYVRIPKTFLVDFE